MKARRRIETIKRILRHSGPESNELSSKLFASEEVHKFCGVVPNPTLKNEIIDSENKHMKVLAPLHVRRFNIKTDLAKLLSLVNGAHLPQSKIVSHANIGTDLVHTFVLEEQNEKNICAVATLLIEPKFIHGAACVAHMVDLVVHETYQEYGIVSPLFQRLKSIAREFLCYKMIADIDEKLLPLYNQFGFVAKEVTMAIKPKPQIVLLPPGFRWRLLQPSDYASNFLSVLEQLTTVGPISKSKFMQQLDLMRQSKCQHVVVIERESTDTKQSKIYATATILIEHKVGRLGQSSGHIEDVVVDSSARGLGLGLKVICILIQIATNEKCAEVVLDCSEKNVAFYEKCGFSRAGISVRCDLP